VRALKFGVVQCRVGNERKNKGVWVCALKIYIAQCKFGNARKIRVHRCAHLNLALHGVGLVMHEKLWCTGVRT
jgi:hypothetical protein